MNISAFAYQYNMQNTLKFGKKKDWTAELTGMYFSPALYDGISKDKGYGSIDMGLQKTILKGKGNLKASVSDILNTTHIISESNFSGSHTITDMKWESRQFKINFSYRFGSSQVKSSRQRRTGLDEESRRANSGNN